jgi:hypothetical protein
MRSITFMGTAAAILTASALLTGPASADRVCKKVCSEGTCRTTCVRNDDHLYMRDRDYHHRGPGVELRGPGVGVDVGR